MLTDQREARTIYSQEHREFQHLAASFLDSVAAPQAERWDEQGMVDREFFSAAAQAGLLGIAIPEQYGGQGVDDFRFNAILGEEIARKAVSSGTTALTLQNDVIQPYFLTLSDEEQKRRWLPGLADGSSIAAIAMTEPDTGSDLAGIRTSAVRDGDDYVINGAKTFISNGWLADLIITVARTSPHRSKGLSLFVVEADRPGFERVRRLEKIGLAAQDTSELAFREVRVPAANMLGAEGSGFAALFANLPQERLSVAIAAVASSEGAFERTLAYVRDRKAFGTAIGSFQHSRFTMATIATELQIARTYVDECVRRHAEGKLTAEDAAAAKWWTTDLQQRVITQCLQLHGGYGYMREYRIARDFEDARVTPIYGGTNEIMKEIIGRGLGL